MVEIRTRQVRANGLSFTVDEAGEGDSIALLLHGFPESRLSWRGQAPALAAEGWHVVAPDMRGYGETSRPRGVEAYRMARLTEDAAALFDVLGARRRLLIGHDWGGLVAWAFAIERRRWLDGLIIVNAPHPAIYRALLARSPAQWARSWYVLFFQLPGLPEAVLTARDARAVTQAFEKTPRGLSFLAAETLARFRANALAPGAMTAMVNYYRANARGLAMGRQADSRRIETPTLMIWGDRDPFLGVALTEGYAAYVADFTLRRLPDVSHWGPLEAPARVNALMAEWLAEQGLAGRIG